MPKQKMTGALSLILLTIFLTATGSSLEENLPEKSVDSVDKLALQMLQAKVSLKLEITVYKA